MSCNDSAETKTIITGLLTSNPLRCTVKQLCKDFMDMVGYNIPIRQLGFTTVEDYLRSIPDTVRVYGTGLQAEVEGVIKPKSAHINLLVSKQKKHKIPPHKQRLIKRGSAQASPVNYRSNNTSTVFLCEPSTSQDDPGCSQLKEQVPHKPKEHNNIFKKILEDDYDDQSIKKNYTTKIPPFIQNNLRKLILQFPNGIWCTKLPAEYYKMFKKRLCYDKYNYRSLIEMCSDLSEIFHYIQATDDDFILYDVNKPVPSLNQNDIVPNHIETEIVATQNILSEIPNIDWSLGPAIIPPDVMHLSEEIPRYFPDVEVGNYLDISIGEIYDISKFWFYMTFGELSSLMLELQQFFSNQKNKYFIPELLLAEGLYCVTLYDGEYHRSVIVNLLPRQTGFVRVLFIDYGTIGNVNSSEVWFLPRKFGKLPSQAVRARLSNIYPILENSTWPIKAINRFRQMTTNTVLVGEVTNINDEDNILEIYLADITNENNIFYVNDVLVKEGLAIYTDQERKKVPIDSNCKPIINYLHLYPEFSEIESGKAPSVSEMNYIIQNKIPFHYYMAQYFDIDIQEENITDIEQQHLSFFPKYKFKFMEECGDRLLEDENQFDYSLFPGNLCKEIENMVKLSKATKSKTVVTSKIPVIKGEKWCNYGENGAEKSVGEYSCNKKRISELIHSENINSKSGGRSISLPLTQEDTFPLNNTLKNMNLNKSETVWLHPTNPFFNDCHKDANNDSNPFRTSNANPFTNDDFDEVIKSDLFEVFKKSSDESINIVNNLKPIENFCACKVSNKEVNVHKMNLISRCETYENRPSEVAERPVRPPPGFLPHNHMPSFNGQYYNFFPNNFLINPFYQVPQTQFPHAVFPPNQFGFNQQLQCSNNFIPPTIPYFSQSLTAPKFNQYEQTPPNYQNSIQVEKLNSKK